MVVNAGKGKCRIFVKYKELHFLNINICLILLTNWVRKGVLITLFSCINSHSRNVNRRVCKISRAAPIVYCYGVFIKFFFCFFF